MRLIDADTLKQALKSNCTPELCHDYNTAWCESCCLHNFFEDLIDDAPTVESDYEWGYSEGVHDTERATSKGLLVQNERPQGEWKATGQTMGLYYVYACNKCGIYNKGKTNFCPNCGAKMKGGAE